MATELKHTDKLAIGSATRTVTMKTERFETESYSVRASIGINPVQSSYDVEWVGLTADEAGELISDFDSAGGVGLFLWTPPLYDSDQKFTIDGYTVEETGAANVAYSISTNLRREWDI